MAAWFPPPLVGVALLLVVLIFLTPNLLSTGSPAAGTYPTQAELLVDRGTLEPNVTHLYVKSVGNVRYANLTMALATNLTWPVSLHETIVWNATTVENDSLYISETTTANPVAVNVTATYVDPTGTTVVYGGAYAFYFQGNNLYTEVLSTAGSVPPTTLAALPLYILLPVISTRGT